MSEKNNFSVSEKEILEQKEFTEKVFALNQEFFDKNGYQRLAYIKSYGCQGNVADGEKLKGMAANMGFGFTDTADNADFVLYNTCAVRENAEDRIYGNVGALKHYKRRNPDMIIGLCGCMMQQPHIVEKLKKSFPYVDMIFGTHVLHKMPEIVYEAYTSGKRVFETPQSKGVIVEDLPVRRDGKIKAWVPIMYGCNNFCTYCIVPYVRGRERSRKSEDIINEIKALIKDGYKEITLLGQNVNSYGKGLEEEINFSKLLRRINDLDGDFRIRFMTSHPKDASKELIDTIAECRKVCKHIHLPVQSGSDRILKLMNRHYTRADYLKLISYAKEKIPEASFTTDIIVGFPNETREDFEATLSLIKQVEYDSMFSFIYSKRVGTKAAEMVDTTSDEDKGRWFRELLEVQKEIGINRYNRYVGKTVKVLVDGEGKSGKEYLTGRTDNFIIVDFIGDKSLIGSFVNVKITKALNWALLGEII